MLTFWQIYFPVFAAGVSSFLVAGSLHMGVGYYFHKKQQRRQKEFETKVANGEIDPLGAMSGGVFNMEEHEFPVDRFARPTASGQEGPKDGIGQYL
jgi:hypothetical protein